MADVRLADGTYQPIPTGAPGSYPWVREANWIALAYRQANDFPQSLKWTQEYHKRRLAWDSREAVADYQAVIDAGSWLDGARVIINWVGKTIDDFVNLGKEAGKELIDWAKWLPVLLAGGLVVVGIGVYRGSLQARLRR